MPAPLKATFMEWSRDGVGRLKVAETGEWLRVGASACAGFLPVVGLEVEVLSTAPHPLGGLKAVAVRLATGTDAVALLDRTQQLPGLDDLPWFVESTDAVGFFGVIIKSPLRSRVALRDWLAARGVEVDFANPDRPTVRAGERVFRVFVVNGALPMGGQAVVTFASTSTLSIKKEREVRGPGALTTAQLQSLVEVVRRCASGEAGVIVHQAPGALWAADAWCAVDPLTASLFVSEPKPGTVTLTGLAPFLLPDLYVTGRALAEVAPALHAAARALLSGDARSVESLGGLRVVGRSHGWIELTP